MDTDGKIVREGKVASDPGELVAWFKALGLSLERVGLGAGPLFQWLFAAMRHPGLSAELLETRHVWDASKAILVKTDRIAALVAGHATLTVVAQALLAVRAALLRELDGYEKRVRRIAREDTRVWLLMSAPGGGAIVALTYVSAIDDPLRFRSSKMAGAHFGLTPKKYQSGETNVTSRITKIGDGAVRTALYEAANVILTRPIKGGALKNWAARLAKRAGINRAKVALARKLALILQRTWIDGTVFDPDKACGEMGHQT